MLKVYTILFQSHDYSWIIFVLWLKCFSISSVPISPGLVNICVNCSINNSADFKWKKEGCLLCFYNRPVEGATEICLQDIFKFDTFFYLGNTSILEIVYVFCLQWVLHRRKWVKTMEITCEVFGWMIFYDFEKDLIWREFLVSLRENVSDEAASEKTVYNWFVEFHCGRVSVSDR